MRLTGDGLDVVGGMHRHHLCVNAKAISVMGVETGWDLDEGGRRRDFGVEVVANRIRPPVDAELGIVVFGHGEGGWMDG